MNLFLLSLSLTLFSCAQIKGLKTSLPIPTQTRTEAPLKLSWNKNLDPEYDLGNLPIGWVTPALHEDRLYVGDLSGNLRIYDVHNGRLLHIFNEGGAIQGRPLIKDDRIIYGTVNGDLIARSLTDFSVVYKVNLGSPIESEIVSEDKRIFVHLRGHTIVALDFKAGKVLWSYKRAIAFLTTLNRVSIPFIYKNFLIVGFADGNVGALSVADGSLKWEEKIVTGKKFIDVDIRPKLIDGKLWVSSMLGDVVMMNPNTGTVLRRIQRKVAVRALEYQKKVLLLTDQGHIVASDKSGSILFDKKIGDDGFSSAVIWKNRLYASTFGGKIYSFDQDLNQIEGKFELGNENSSLFGHLESDEEHLAAYSSRNRLYVFK
jgi:outer membrane protein assembly factor BamB